MDRINVFDTKLWGGKFTNVDSDDNFEKTIDLFKLSTKFKNASC